MITKLPMGVDKHSWWQDVNTGRIFVIVSIGLYWDEDIPLAYTNITMLQFGQSDDIVVSAEVFIQEADAGKIIPYKQSVKR